MRALIMAVRRHDKINNFAAFKMGPVLASPGKSYQAKRCTCCQWCVEGNDARAGASDDGKRTNNGAVW